MTRLTDLTDVQPERQKLLAELQAQQQQRGELKAELAAFGAADPIKYERKKRAGEVCKEAAQRWTGELIIDSGQAVLMTDNTLVLIQYTRSLGMEDADIRLQLGISGSVACDARSQADEDWDDLPQ